MAIGGGYTGNEVAFSLSYDQTDTVPTNFERIGMVRNKEFGVEWETVDITADTSTGLVREFLTTFKSMPVTLSGISRVEEEENQEVMEMFVNNPPNNNPRAWARFERPASNDRVLVYTFPVLLTSFRITGNYDAAVEWNCDAQATGEITIEYTGGA